MSPGPGVPPAERRLGYFTQWAAQFFVGAELTRCGYVVSYPLGNAPVTDLQITSPTGDSFPVEVKGLKSANFWLVRKPDASRRRFYIFVLVSAVEPFSAPRYFIMTAKELAAIHLDAPKGAGANFGPVKAYENAWRTLPR
jgi:hypothetical protein